ncbi:alpha/beta hydrolase [Burkholderiaceae bacterium DAT-1]|nr:alpha/beta hydrolase [Burkholderiaceae bacterium DAT-1]
MNSLIKWQQSAVTAAILGASAIYAYCEQPAIRQPISATAPQPITLGESFTISSRHLNEIRRINVYVPPGYRESPNAQLPVIYMPDGGMAEDFLHVAGLMQVSLANGTMRPFILVGIENTERRRDLTGPSTQEADRKIALRTGGSAAFRAFIRDELFPVIESRYRVTPERAIVGESLAGLFALETLIASPEMFSAYIAIDPSLWWNNSQLTQDTATFLKTHPDLTATIYLSSSGNGNDDSVKSYAGMIRHGNHAGIRHRFDEMPQELHQTIYEPSALNAFRWAFRGADSPLPR